MSRAVPPATPRSRLPVAERQPQILRAAIEEFAARGYAGARMAAVGSRAGVTKGLLYHYFPGGKADLFRAAVAECVRPTLAEVEALRKDFSGSQRALLTAMLHLAYEERVHNDQQQRILFRLLLAEARTFPELAETYRTEILDPAMALLREVLRAGAAAGEFRPGVAEEAGLAHVLLAPLFMSSIWEMMLGEGRMPALAALRDAHIASVLRMLAPEAR